MKKNKLNYLLNEVRYMKKRGMFCVNAAFAVLIFLSGLGVSGCASVIYRTVVDSETEAIKPAIGKKKAVETIIMVLTDQGLDIKMADKDLGLISTEWKKIGSYGDKPPFDYFVQIKVKIVEKNEQLRIKFTPMLKQVNRINTGAFNEFELFYDPKLGSNSLVARELAKGTILYNNVITEICTRLDLSFDKVNHTYSQIETGI